MSFFCERLVLSSRGLYVGADPSSRGVIPHVESLSVFSKIRKTGGES
jgi:hypothetical protein